MAIDEIYRTDVEIGFNIAPDTTAWLCWGEGGERLVIGRFGLPCNALGRRIAEFQQMVFDKPTIAAMLNLWTSGELQKRIAFCKRNWVAMVLATGSLEKAEGLIIRPTMIILTCCQFFQPLTHDEFVEMLLFLSHTSTYDTNVVPCTFETAN